MDFVSNTLAESLDLKSHPAFMPECCVNRRQRRYSCFRCAEICPHAVFPHESGGTLVWERCTDCSLCVAACPTRALAPSEPTRRTYTEASELSGAVRITCRREEALGELRTDCLAAVPWELLAALALRTELVLCVRPCTACKLEWKKLLQANLASLRNFLGEERYRERVRLVREGEAVPSPQEEESDEKLVTRRELFSGMRKNLMKRFFHAAEKRLPFLSETDGGALKYRRLLSEAVKAGQSADEEKRARYGVWLPRFNAACFGCGICEKLCPHQALSIVREENGSRLISIEPYKCSGCSMCVELCPHGGLDGLALFSVPHLEKLPLVRVASSSCIQCGKVLPPGTEPPLCRRCAANTRKNRI